MVTITLALALGVVIGVLLGLFGGGGSSLAVPALIYALGLDVEQATPISLIVIAVASAFGALPKVLAHQVLWRVAAIFATVGIPATFVGTTIGHHVPQPAITIGRAAVMIAAGVLMLFDRSGTTTSIACAVDKNGINRRRRARRSIPAGVFAGLLTGLFGVGGGFLISPALVMLGVEMPIAIGTSLLITATNSAAGVISHLHGANFHWSIATAFAGTAIAGSLIASHLGTKTDARRLQHWFAFVLFAIAGYVLVDTVMMHNPSTSAQSPYRHPLSSTPPSACALAASCIPSSHACAVPLPRRN
jgi:uncharacterized protein